MFPRRIDPRLPDRGRQLNRCEGTVQMLDDAMKGLELLMEEMEKMDVLASYWLAMDAALEDIYGRVEILRNNQLLELKLKGLRRDWNRVEGEYFEYTREVRTQYSIEWQALTSNPVDEAGRS